MLDDIGTPINNMSLGLNSNDNLKYFIIINSINNSNFDINIASNLNKLPSSIGCILSRLFIKITIPEDNTSMIINPNQNNKLIITAL